MSRYPLEGYRERCDRTSCSAAITAQSAPPGDPDHDRRDELRRAVRARQGGARPRRERARDEHDDRRRRHDARGARALEPARLPAAAVALRDEPGRPAQSRCDRGRGGPGREAAAAAACCSVRRSPTASPRCATSPRASTSGAPAATRFDRARRSRDQDRRAPRDHRLGEADLHQGRRQRGRTTTPRSRSSRAPTWSCSTACRAARPPRRRSSSSTSGSRRWRRSGPPSTRCSSWASTARSSSSCRAASGAGRTSPRRSRLAPTPSRSAWPR